MCQREERTSLKPANPLAREWAWLIISQRGGEETLAKLNIVYLVARTHGPYTSPGAGLPFRPLRPVPGRLSWTFAKLLSFCHRHHLHKEVDDPLEKVWKSHTYLLLTVPMRQALADEADVYVLARALKRGWREWDGRGLWVSERNFSNKLSCVHSSHSKVTRLTGCKMLSRRGV